MLREVLTASWRFSSLWVPLSYECFGLLVVNEALLPDGLVQGSEVLELMLQMSNYVPSMHKQEGRVKDAVRGSQFRLYRFAHQVMGVDHLRLWEEDFRRRCGIDPLKEKEWLAYTTIWKEMSKDEYSPQNRYGAQARLPLESSSTAKVRLYCFPKPS